jgi:uncharacterized membrane protein YkvA (DUF1232 family)
MANDEFYNTLRQKVAGYSGQYAEYILLIPDLFLLISRLMLDKRVDSRYKVYLGAALAYVVSPIDLIPDRIFGALGYIDDIAVMVAVLNIMLKELDNQVILENWSGSADLLSTIRKFLDQADQMVGKQRLDKILEHIGVHKPQGAPPAAG